MTINYDKQSDTIELDNGHQFISVSIEDAKELQERLVNIINELTEEFDEKDYKYYGGL